VWSIFWTGGAPATALNGTHDTPVGRDGWAGICCRWGFRGAGYRRVACDVSYHKDGGAQSDTHDGILLVTVIRILCHRCSFVG